MAGQGVAVRSIKTCCVAAQIAGAQAGCLIRAWYVYRITPLQQFVPVRSLARRSAVHALQSSASQLGAEWERRMNGNERKESLKGRQPGSNEAGRRYELRNMREVERSKERVCTAASPHRAAHKADMPRLWRGEAP